MLRLGLGLTMLGCSSIALVILLALLAAVWGVSC